MGTGLQKVVKQQDEDFTLHAMYAADMFAEDLVGTMAVKVAEKAKRNVNPGSGPGPHPHRAGSDHIDTGFLSDSIEVVMSTRTNNGAAALVGTFDGGGNDGYAIYNELGWVTKKHNIVRYPFLTPAAIEAYQDSASVIKAASMRNFDNLLIAAKLKTSLSGIQTRARLTGTFKFRKTYRPYRRTKYG